MTNLVQNISNIMRKPTNGHDLAENALGNSEMINSNSNAVKVNLTDYGYKQAGRHDGNPDALRNHMDMIRSGQIIDENSNEEKHRKLREEMDAKILDQKHALADKEGEIRKVKESLIPGVENAIKNASEEMNRVELEYLKKEEPVKRNWFNIIEFGISAFFLTIFLYMFYVSAAHSAFFRDIAAEVSNADSGNISSVLNTVFSVGAYSYFHMHWLVPFVFFAFAMVLHVIWEMTSGWRIPALITIMLFILSADGLLAYFIENNNHTIKTLMGTVEGEWYFYKSPVFYMVLVMGFFSCIGWSIIMYQVKKELPGTDNRMKRIAVKELTILRNKIWEMEQEKIGFNGVIINYEKEMESIQQKINYFEKEKSNVSYSIPMLKKNISSFYNGWLSYLNGKKDARQWVSECENVRAGFLQTLGE